ncbi:cysteine desulfurase [Brachybacterium sp. SGAir0954]|uniref:cysteine desulfurase family protein n=1 Tax=Brachybacterium sp. SGAir0954 TaxID=2571029 RepID=UPI0010CD4F95|nr:aminotransferase class V-fold PLP-dependent enzyme [Brachybacterium sp. SGAir0954]QCR53764.1 cysteine desulfurase [Brachybacterium sp. SGAir0954]
MVSALDPAAPDPAVPDPEESAQRRAYLDHAATTVLRPAAAEAYLRAAAVRGNPSAMHASGRAARTVLDDALEEIGELLGVPRSWLIMTSGGTEADNLALRAAPLGVLAQDPARTAVAVCATDHPAVLATARSLAPTIEARELAVDAAGLLDAGAVEQVLADGAVGVLSAALVNNETGARQDVAALAAAARRHGTLVHTDAVQALGHVDLPALEDLDLMSLTGHKIGAPVGVGVLVARPEVPFAALSTGGGQQRGVRSGTLDGPHAAAFAAALREVLAERAEQAGRLRELAARMREGIARIDPEARFTLPEDSPQSGHIVHVVFPGADSDALLFLLDERGVDSSAGSACSAGVTQHSPVLAAMGMDAARSRGALRLSLGWTSTAEDVDLLLAALPESLRRARAVGALAR